MKSISINIPEEFKREFKKYKYKVWSENFELGEPYREWKEDYYECFQQVVKENIGWYKKMIKAGVPENIAKLILPNCVIIK